jgi:hypothetical protein
MATEISVQDMPANGAPIDDVVFTAAASEMYFKNDGNMILLAKGATAPGGDVVAQGVAALDSGRDLDSTIDVPVNGLNVAGPFKPRNFNQAGVVNLTLASTVDISLAVVRVRPEL